MSIEDVVLVATVREDICNHGSRAEIPVLIEATQARIAHAAGDDTSPPSSKSRPSEKEEPSSTEVVTAGPGAEGDSDSGSKTVATTLSEEDDKREGYEHVVSPSVAWLSNGAQVIDMILVKKAEAAVSSAGENNKQEVEQQIQKANSENNPSDRVEEVASKTGDETSEKGSKAIESPGETRYDVGADKVKSETASGEVASIAAALTEEPEVQEQTETQGSASEAAARPAGPPRPAPVAEAANRATPLYWRRLTSRYMTTSPMPS